MRRTPVLVLATFFASSLFAAGHDLTTSAPTANQLMPVVAGNSSGFTAAWIEQTLARNTVVSSVVGANGEPVEGGVAATDSPPVSSLAIAHSPSDTLLVWTADDKVIAERLSPSGKPLNTTLVTFGKGYVSNAAVAWNGSRYFVTWSSGVQLAGAFVAPNGSSTAPRIFFSEPVVSGQPQKELLLAPDLAWDGQHFIVVFGEVLNALCSFTCPGPIPDRFRVMRVSADGDAIDSPLIITGSHLRARVASSGSESLIVLDSFRDVSTIVVHTDGSLTLDAETPLFSWVSDISSAVVWDDATFTVGWTYRDVDANWIGAAHVTRSGLPFDYRFTAAAAFPSVFWGWPAMAVNEAGDAAFVISERSGQPSSFARAHLYLASEFLPMPPPPPAPRNVVSYFGGTTARIDWQSDPASGFVIDSWWPFYQTWFSGTIPGDARSATVYAAVGNLVRVRAFGPGGLSDATITTIGSIPRRRAAITH